jgi:hypothetical protein
MVCGIFFVAGSSVFPTGGFANPTLTIVALALCLATYLQSELQSTPRVQAQPNTGADSDLCKDLEQPKGAEGRSAIPR